MRSKIQRSMDGPGGATDAFAAGDQQLRLVGDPNVTKALPDRFALRTRQPGQSSLTNVNQLTRGDIRMPTWVLRSLGALDDRMLELRAGGDDHLLGTQANLAHMTRITSLGELAASIAHEVNQPLAAAIANAEACLRWLDRETPDLAAARRSAEWVINDGNRATEVIRRVRALATKTDIEKEPLDINDVVREVVALVQREVTSQQVSLRMELAPALPVTFGDRVQLQQVMINLMMNGVEAMKLITDRPRELVIRSQLDEIENVLTSVTDCGAGISAENMDRLFTPFFTTKSSGMGMGLSISRSIIEAHGGRLWATANFPSGAMFQFSLPVNTDKAS